MGFFGKKDSPPPSQDIIESVPAADPEKHASPQHDETATPDVCATAPTIDPAVEKRLLRKLDWNLVTLVSFFCMFR